MSGQRGSRLLQIRATSDLNVHKYQKRRDDMATARQRWLDNTEIMNDSINKNGMQDFFALP